MISFYNIIHSPTVKNGAVFTFFAFCNNGISFVLLLILAKFIEPGEYGQLNLFNTFVQLFSIFISLGTSGYSAVAFFKKERRELQRTYNSILITATATLFIFFSILSCFSSSFESIFGIDVSYQWIALLICYFQLFNSINLDIWRLEEKPVIYGIYSLSSVLLNFGITLFLVISLKKGWLGRIYAQSIVAVIYFFISLFFLIKRKYLSLKWPEKNLFKEILSFGIPLIPHQASGWLKQGADRYIINSFLSLSLVGFYSFALNLSNILLIIGTSFNSTNSVYIYKCLANGYRSCKDKLLQHEKSMMLIYTLIAILLAIFSYILIPLFMPKYAESVTYVFPLFLSALFGCFYMLFVNYLFFFGKTKQLMFVTFGVASTQVALSFLFTRYGALYTSIINMLSQFATFILVFILSRKVLKQQEQLESIEHDEL